MLNKRKMLKMKMIEITYAVRTKNNRWLRKIYHAYLKKTMFFFHLQHVIHKSYSWVKNIAVKFNWFKMKSTILQNRNEKMNGKVNSLDERKKSVKNVVSQIKGSQNHHSLIVLSLFIRTFAIIIKPVQRDECIKSIVFHIQS